MLTRSQLPILGGVRIVLLVGFGGLIALFGSSALYVMRVLERVDALDDRGTNDYLESSRALQAVRTESARAAVAVRDYVLDPKASELERHRATAESAWRETFTAVGQYRAIASPEAKRGIRDLEKALVRYWAVASRIIRLESQQRSSAYEMLARQLTPLRDEYNLQIEELADEDETRLRTSIVDAASLIERFRSSLGWGLAVVLAFSLGLATFSIVSMFRLERTAKERYQASLEDRAELEKLSARLVDIQEEERRRIARELHDEVGQSLSALLVDAGHARKHLPDGLAADFRLRLESIKHLGETTLNAVRNLCLLLRPSMLDDLGLIPALEWQARETSRRTGIRVDLQAPDELELPDAYRTTIYRVVQEALHNVARHSGARLVQVAVRASNGQILVMVKDDGKGFDPKITRGMGLLGMEERVVHLNGELEIRSEPGKGALIKAVLPLAETAGPETALMVETERRDHNPVS